MSRLLNKVGWIVAGALALLVVAAITGIVWGGPLQPPGPPSDGPTGRTQIFSLPYTINQPGSYVVERNLSCAAFPACVGTTSAITITATNVTLDLNGFSVNGHNGICGDGVGSAVSASVPVTVVNGTLLQGMSASGGSFDNLTIAGDPSCAKEESGLNLSNALVTNCNITGLSAVSGSQLANSSVSGCLLKDTTVSVSTGSALTGNTFKSANLVVTGEGNLIRDNHITATTGAGQAGISVNATASYNRIEGNNVENSTKGYVIMGSHNLLIGNSAGNIAVGPEFNNTGANNTIGPDNVVY